jgi:DNA-binding NtrC family response regulator
LSAQPAASLIVAEHVRASRLPRVAASHVEILVWGLCAQTGGAKIAGSADLSDVRILVVEDSWHIGTALKSLLRALGAEVLGPVATAAEAERLIAEQMPDASIVDFNLRGGELATGLIDKLSELGILVIVISGYASVPILPGKAAAILQKPLVESQLLAALLPLAKQKRA